MEHNTFTDRIIAEVQAQQQQLTAALDGLDESGLTWQPASGKWSVIECLEHLNISYRWYLPRMEAAIEKGKAAGHTPNTDYRRGFWGRRMPKMFRPKAQAEAAESGTQRFKIPWKMKTMKRFQPQVAPGQSEKVIAEFRAHLETVKRLAQASQAVDLGRVRVISAIGSLLKFKLGDAFEFVNAHTDRHLLQAARVRTAMAQTSAQTMVGNA
ncbi:MAG: DinB family protein [Bacteroidota bacterium]